MTCGDCAECIPSFPGGICNKTNGYVHMNMDACVHFKEPPEKEKTVTQIIEEVSREMCMYYCKYLIDWDKEKNGPKIGDKTCLKCPLSRLY